MENREVTSESTGVEGNASEEEYDFHYRKRAVYLKEEIALLLKKIDRTSENGRKG